MAIWQTDLFIIKDSISIQISEENEEDILYWGELLLENDSIKAISEILHQEKSWTDKIIQYGKSDETCLQLFYDDSLLCSIVCRIDVRSISLVVLKELVKFMKINNASILFDWEVYPSSLESLLTVIKKSSAFQFCSDPKKFLDEIDITNN